MAADGASCFIRLQRVCASAWAGTARTATLTRERRLREELLIEVRCGVWGEGKLLACTRDGLCASGHLPGSDTSHHSAVCGGDHRDSETCAFA